MGYVIKTKDACFAIDLVQPDSKRLVEILDFAIVSHAHADHFDKDFVKAMVERGKTVYSPFYEQGTVIKSTGEFNFKEVSLRFTMNMQGNTRSLFPRLIVVLRQKIIRYTISLMRVNWPR